MNLQVKYNRDEFMVFLESFVPKFKKDLRRVDFDGLKVTKNAHCLGECPELDLSIFELTHTSSRDARVALANDGFKIMKNSAVFKALVIYQANNSNDWRLSLMTATPDVNQKGKIVQTFSNPRRLSFFLGPDAKIHTPEDFLIQKGPIKNFPDLISRFDVEIVTKEFFAHYRKLFERLSDHLENDHAFKNFAGRNQINIHTFAKKLLGQIVFCYFLQKKGWLGAPKGKKINEGDKDFMRSLFDRCAAEKKNFYNDYLEHLFYDSLNNRSESAGDFYRNYFKCQIPFLNGGLFEPLEGYDWKKSFLRIPDTLFSNGEGTGILDVFDLYNFTVYEEDPVDREVAVDPEMLGKVFENLLEENLRKGKGTYYTPREIVHYMCQESLINYLTSETKIDEERVRKLINFKSNVITQEHVSKNKKSGTLTLFEAESTLLDQALASIRVCDPACGSGAFLVGMLSEIVSARKVLDFILDHERDDYKLKKETIQNCIYGVDIDPGAVEIAKLRLWLSLVVDHELADIEPLPNLDYKIMCGNSLLEELIVGDESIELFDPGVLEKDKPKRKVSDKVMQIDLFEQDSGKYLEILRRLHLEYFHETDTQMKKVVREKIEKIELDFIQSSINKRIREIEERIKNLNMQKPDDRKKNAVLLKQKLELMAIPSDIRKSKVRPYFLWHLNFLEVFQEKGGFDIVIANPPYLEARSPDFSENMKRELQISIQIQWGGEAGDNIGRGCDLLVYFLLFSIRIINQGGCSIFLTQNAWLDTVYGKKFQKYLLEQCYVKAIIDSDYKYFDSQLGPNINTVITIFQKFEDASKNEQKSLFARFHINFEGSDVSISKLLQGDLIEGVNAKRFDYNYLKTAPMKWGVLLAITEKMEGIIDKLLQRGKFLDEIGADCGQGLNLDKSFFIDNALIREFGVKRDALVSFLDSGAPFVLNRTDRYLVLKENISPEIRKKFKEAKHSLYDLKDTKKSRPVLILPRGIGRHYCCLNVIGAFSASGVDIYLSDNVPDFEAIRLRLWVFLNSSLCWLIRELSGRKNLGGGMLKAEAVDLKDYPLYFDLDLKQSDKILQLLSSREAKTILEEIETQEHSLIDDLVFEHLGLKPSERKEVLNNLKSLVLARERKSRA
jgi:type I restriction-modification system DNA methylase subunit